MTGHDQRRRLITLRDVARAAGVSNSTASRALTGSHPVTDDKHSRVLEAAQRLQYRPNSAARALRQARSMNLGVVFDRLEGPTVLGILGGVTSAAQEAGYSVLVTQSQGSPERYGAMMRHLFEAGVDGLFLVVPHSLDP